MQCEYGGECNSETYVEVHAQWTVVDFIHFAVCMEHLHEMVEGLSQMRVDGQLPTDVWLKWYDAG